MSRQKDKKSIPQIQRPGADEKLVEILTGVILFAFGVYQSILYFGHTAVPNGDFPDFYKVGSDLLAFRLPSQFMRAPVLGLLQNFLYPLAWGPSRELTAGWLLNAILHPFNLLLLWLIGKKIIGKAAPWLALLLIINPTTVYLLTEPIIETTFLFFILLSFYLIFKQTRWAYLAAATASMVRYEAALLILAAFLADIILHRKEKKRFIKSITCLCLASLPLAIWMSGTLFTWKPGTTHYVSILFGKEYSKGFVEPAENRTGIALNANVLWHTGFAPILAPYPGADKNTADMIFKLYLLLVIGGFFLGCIISIIKRQWQIWMLLLFFFPYFLLHCFYPYPMSRFHSITVWIVMFVCWFGLQDLWRLASDKWGIPKVFAIVFQIAVIIIAGLWLAGLAPYMHRQSSLFSPRCASIPYVAIAVAALIFAGRLYTEKIPGLLKGLAILAATSLMIVSNQFTLVRLVGDGQKEIEFRQLGEWFAANAGPNDKIAVYNCGPAGLFAGKAADRIIYYPKADTPRQLAEKLREMNITYVTWATREGTTTQHTGYQLAGLNKTIPFLSQSRNIGCYEFVKKIPSNRGFINVFRLKDTGDELLPVSEN